MPERKVWGSQEDRILKYLREERQERKWATIARLMHQQYSLPGRTGKQCRERYHNHLDSSIVNAEWTAQEEQTLFAMHEEVGNKWSLIAHQLPGRSDNCVKNHFYSRLRRAIRKLNRLALHLPPLRLLKNNALSRILETTDSQFKLTTRIDEDLALFANNIKNRLFRFQLDDQEHPQPHELAQAEMLINDIEQFEKDSKRGYRAPRRHQEPEYKTYLKPPRNTAIKRQLSSCSDRSDDISSFLSSQNYSSCSELSDLPQKQPSSTTAPRSSNHSSARNSDIQQPKEGAVKGQGEGGQEGEGMSPMGEGVSLMKVEGQGVGVEAFEREHMELVEESSLVEQQPFSYFNSMMYEDTPLVARILAPDMRMGSSQEQDQLFPLPRLGARKLSDD